MAKSWKSFVKNNNKAEASGNEPSLPDMQALAAENEVLRELLEERQRLEKQMQDITGQQKDSQQAADRYSNEIPSFGQRKKNDTEWQRQKARLLKKEEERKQEFKKWEERKTALAQKIKQSDEKIKAAEKLKLAWEQKIEALRKKREMAAGFLQRPAVQKKEKPKDDFAERGNKKPAGKEKPKTVKDNATGAVNRLKALNKEKKKAEGFFEKTAPVAKPFFERVKKNPKEELKSLPDKIKKLVKEKDTFAKPLKEIKDKLTLVKEKAKVLQKPAGNLDEKREQLKEKLLLKKKLEQQFEQRGKKGFESAEDLMTLKTDAEKKIKAIEEADDFDKREKKKPASEPEPKPKEPDPVKSEERKEAEKDERKEAEKEEEKKKKREEERKENRLRERQEQRREERKSERKKDKYN